MLGTGLASEVPTHMLTLVCKHTHISRHLCTHISILLYTQRCKIKVRLLGRSHAIWARAGP